MNQKPSQQQVTKLISVPDAARFLGLSVATLAKKRMEKRGPRYVKIGARVFYRQSDLAEYIQACAVETADSNRDAA